MTANSLNDIFPFAGDAGEPDIFHWSGLSMNVHWCRPEAGHYQCFSSVFQPQLGCEEFMLAK